MPLTDNQAAVNMKEEIQEKKSEYKVLLNKFIQDRQSKDSKNIDSEFREVHDAFVIYINCYENMLSNSDLLGATSSETWMTKLSQDCYTVLETVCLHYEAIKAFETSYGVIAKNYKPSTFAYHDMQKAAKMYVPIKDIENLRAKFSVYNLPTRGFDDPVNHIVGATNMTIQLFISHSAKDVKIATEFIEMLNGVFVIDSNEIIRCTSVPGYKIRGGAFTRDVLYNDLHSCVIAIGIMTEHSTKSMWVGAELGALWSMKKTAKLLLNKNTKFSEIEGPLANANHLRLNDKQDLHQLVDEMTEELNWPKRNSPSINSAIEKFLRAGQ